MAQQQCCGPLQLPVADVAVMAQSHFGLTGAATAIGEQPLKGLINPAAMARIALGEALTNLIWAAATGIEDIKASVNWMCVIPCTVEDLMPSLTQILEHFLGLLGSCDERRKPQGVCQLRLCMVRCDMYAY